jgi:hypothetical protein
MESRQEAIRSTDPITSSSPYSSRILRTPRVERGSEGEEARDDGQAVAPATAERALRCGRVGAEPAHPCRFPPQFWLQNELRRGLRLEHSSELMRRPDAGHGVGGEVSRESKRWARPTRGGEDSAIIVGCLPTWQKMGKIETVTKKMIGLMDPFYWACSIGFV